MKLNSLSQNFGFCFSHTIFEKLQVFLLYHLLFYFDQDPQYKYLVWEILENLPIKKVIK